MRNESGVVFVGVIFVVLAMLAAPILLVWLYPEQLYRILTGWLVAVVALIASVLYSLFRKK